MVKMYVPELSDVIILDKDWIFFLYNECRNQTMYDFFKLDKKTEISYYPTTDEYNKLVKNENSLRREKYTLDMKIRNSYYKDPKYNLSIEEKKNINKRLTEIKKEIKPINLQISALEREHNKKQAHEITLPRGLKLIVDRIYIRKGAADFSSISFRIEKEEVLRVYQKDINPLNKKQFGKVVSLRFWAKLEDVNNMYYQKYDIGE